MVAIASINALCQKLFYKGKVPLSQFIINADIGFDEEQFKLDEERSKERDLSAYQLRQQMILQKNLFKNLNAGYQWNNRRERQRFQAKSNIQNNFKQMMKYHNDFMKVNMKNQTWSKDHCGFWNHPSMSCKFGEKCTKKHKCPNCDGNHILSSCPHFNTKNAKEHSGSNPQTKQ